MNNEIPLQIYIVVHSIESFNMFKFNNKHNDNLIKDFKYILVGEYPYFNGIDIDCKTLKHNIEQYKNLLTFTAWWALVKNNILVENKNQYIGIFEYDTIILNDMNNLIDIFENNKIYGFIKRTMPDNLFLNCIPEFKRLLKQSELYWALKNSFWLPTSNMITSKDMLIQFVEWYEKFIPEIIKYNRHGHFHERAINVFGATKMVYCENYLTHLQLVSHKINL